MGATPPVLRRLAKCRTPGVKESFERLVARLRENPRFVTPDQRTIWARPWPDLPNHRHHDLPGAWRACWTVRHGSRGDLVTLVFLGTHKEYEECYGFTKH